MGFPSQEKKCSKLLCNIFFHIWSRTLAAGKALTTEKGSTGLPRTKIAK
jgi:hypothetical protein